MRVVSAYWLDNFERRAELNCCRWEGARDLHVQRGARAVMLRAQLSGWRACRSIVVAVVMFPAAMTAVVVPVMFVFVVIVAVVAVSWRRLVDHGGRRCINDGRRCLVHRLGCGINRTGNAEIDTDIGMGGCGAADTRPCESCEEIKRQAIHDDLYSSQRTRLQWKRILVAELTEGMRRFVNRVTGGKAARKVAVLRFP